MTSARRPGVVALRVAASALAVYLSTLHPTITGGDAGELVTVAARLEIAHPPGYPLYTLLAHAATLVPIGTIAWRVNALSAVCDAATAGLLAGTVTAATGTGGAGIVAGTLFAFAPLTWTYATGAEVFPLHNLLVATLLALALRWRRRRADPGAALPVAAVFGLALAHHHTIVFYGVPIALWMAWHGGRAVLAPRRLAALVATPCAGMALYAYLLIAARHATTLSWGDPATLAGFVDHLLRRDYGTFRLIADAAHGSAGYAARLGAWAAHAGRATLWAGVVLALAGAASAWRAERTSNGPASRAAAGSADAPSATTAAADDAATRDWTRLLVACLALYVLAFHALANAPIANPLFRAVTARFWQQADVATFLLLGVGAARAARRMPRPLAVAAGAALVATQLALGWTQQDPHDDTIACYGRTLLDPLPPDAVLLTRGDLVTNVVRYLQVGEGVRPDVVVLDQELLTKPWYVARAAHEHPALGFPGTVYDPARSDGFSMRDFLDANASSRPIAVYPEWKDGDGSVAGAYELWPLGLASRVAPATAPPTLDAWQRESAAALATVAGAGWRPLASYAPGTWERVAREDVWTASHRRAWWLLVQALRHGREDDDAAMDAARRALEAAAAEHPDPPWYVDRNLGIAYEHLALHDPKWRGPQLAAWRRYLAHAPLDDPGRDAITATVARLERETGTH